MGIVGIFLTLISCCRMYLRLGIVPGIYHSTICIPSWNDSSIAFAIPSGFYFAVFSGITSFILYSTEITIFIIPSVNHIISFYIQTFIGAGLIIYCYFYQIERNHELIGIFLIFISTHCYVITEYSYINVVSIATGILLIIFSALTIIFIKKAMKTLDNHTIGIIIAAVNCFIGSIIVIVFWILKDELLINKSINSIRGVLFCLGCYSVNKSTTIEIALMFIFPTISNMMENPLDSNTIITFVLIFIGFLITLIGDIPFKYCYKFTNRRPKSPLHSPLL